MVDLGGFLCDFAPLRELFRSGSISTARTPRIGQAFGVLFPSIFLRFEAPPIMVKTASTMLPLGTLAPDFSLLNVDGRTVSRADLDGAPALLVAFLCNHCPYVKHIAPEFARLAREYQSKGVAVVAINSNDASHYPDDSPERMVHEAEERGYTFPYLYDEEQTVAQEYRAACTPDFFVFDGQRRLVYRGQMDDSRPKSEIPVTGKDLRAALDAVLAGQPVSAHQRASLGCNIKWREGNEPSYFDPVGVK